MPLPRCPPLARGAPPGQARQVDPAPLRLRDAGPSDLGFVTGLHAEAVPDGFLARLGPRVLREYDRSFLLVPGAVALVAERVGRPVGFVLGSTAAGHNRAALRCCWRRLVPAALLALLVRPLELAALRSRAVRYLRGARATVAGAAPAAPGRPPAVLLHVAVLPDERGSGAGRALVTAFEQRARRAGRDRAVLVTFDPANRGFYARLGWREEPARPGQRGLRFTRGL